MKRLRALLVVLGMAAALVLVPTPAIACSCGSRDVDRAIEDGHAVAVVTRTDPVSVSEGRGSEMATFRVESSIGAEIPDELSAVFDYCVADFLLPGDVGAVVFQQRRTVSADDLRWGGFPPDGDPGSWLIVMCSTAELGSALHRIHGGPAVSGEGPAVALAWGQYDDTGWIAALDSRGRPLTWEARPRYVGIMTVGLPRGRTSARSPGPRTAAWSCGRTGSTCRRSGV